jgi:hypothetical protein
MNSLESMNIIAKEIDPYKKYTTEPIAARHAL